MLLKNILVDKKQKLNNIIEITKIPISFIILKDLQQCSLNYRLL